MKIYREESLSGFEFWSGAKDFAEKLERLRELKSCSGPPLLLVSDSLQHTGAVIDWVKENKWQWKKEIAYNDVDNNYPPYIWGVTVTSFLLDMETLFAQAVKKLDEQTACNNISISGRSKV